MKNFDTYSYVKLFKDVGIQEKQAAAIVNAINKSREHDFLTLAIKDQLTNVSDTLSIKIDIVEEKLSARIDALEEKLTARIDALEIRMDDFEAKVMAEFKAESSLIRAEIKEAFATTMKWQTGMMIPVYTTLIGLCIKMFWVN